MSGNRDAHDTMLMPKRMKQGSPEKAQCMLRHVCSILCSMTFGTCTQLATAMAPWRLKYERMPTNRKMRQCKRPKHFTSGRPIQWSQQPRRARQAHTKTRRMLIATTNTPTYSAPCELVWDPRRAGLVAFVCADRATHQLCVAVCPHGWKALDQGLSASFPCST